MNQGDAAVWAAGIGVSGVVVTALAGLYSSHRASRGLVEAALAGVKAETEMQVGVSVWQAKSDAYSAFLALIGAAHMTIDNALIVGAMAEESTGSVAGAELQQANSAMKESVKAVWNQGSAWHLHLEESEVTAAFALMKQARFAADDAALYLDTVFVPAPGQSGYFTEARRRTSELEKGIQEWAKAARSNLEHFRPGKVSETS
ncbi:hypothetical protein [Streptomyces sp. TRM75563]|uniref:hypothetical protein n=1 Tax=Streptomyces sp. TRM75563 TaxID=2817418 RepID=UPI001F605B00|nr:hypothetical protein [Streptomyces sp. TRM75563]MCI4042451.1 hypothetical protein [Streptomyces sp. TRM75563]